jgi:hypothetical protein
MKSKRRALIATLAIIVLSMSIGLGRSQTTGDALEKCFADPPDEAKPRVWWHWTGGNTTKDGITKDLEWMKRVGIGGAHIADIGMEGGQRVDHKIDFFSPEWFDVVRHAAGESERLGLELSIFSSSGWSLTGGPWIKPAQAMKKLVWSETNAEGPARLDRILPQPPSNPGAFGGLRGLSGNQGASKDAYYGDSIVIAFRTPPDETLMEDLKPIVTGSGGAIDPALLMDDVLSTTVTIFPDKTNTAWIQYEFPQPIKAKAVTLIAPGRGVPFGQIQASDDGKTYRAMVDLPGPVQYRAGGLKTYAFPEVSAKYIRVNMTGAPPSPDEVIYQPEPKPARQYQLSEFIVHTGARVDRWEEKAGFNLIYEYQKVPTPRVPEDSLIHTADVIDLTAKMDSDGTLKWDVPPGKWTILRMGWSLVGSRNRAGTASGVGLEVDKINARHVEAYFHGYMDPIEKALGPLLGKSLRYMMMDSWEAGMQNWTDDMLAQFQQRRGYDPRPYLPALAGRVVGSADISDRFLWDFRRTIVDLVAEAHYGTMADLLRKKGMGIYGEAPGVSMEILEDALLTKSKVEIPMGEFWLGKMHPPPEYYVDVRMAASAAHVYGKKIVAAESFTGGGYDPPTAYKDLADYWFTQGVNRIVFHSSAHQPLDTKPGNTMVGTHFNRNITWAEQAKPFVTYLSRISYMLQQGHSVADIAYLLDEGAPSSQPFWGTGLQPKPPEGYDYDTINADVLLNRMTLSNDGRLVLPDGTSYRILVLPQTNRIRPELLRKIRDFVAGGVILVGPKPDSSPSLQGGVQKPDLEVKALADEIWGDLDKNQPNNRVFGKGIVAWWLPSMSELPQWIAQDVESPVSYSFAPWIHRRAGGADIYFVINRTDSPIKERWSFRVEGQEAEFWYPDTGEIKPAGYYLQKGKTIVDLDLAPHESVFVVFRHPASATGARPGYRPVPLPKISVLTAVKGPWELAFPPNPGAPEKIRMANLQFWTANSKEGVKYFSGTATYIKNIQILQSWLKPNTKLLLDLGIVKDIAQITINGEEVATLWKPPYRADVTKALRAGVNRLEIRITNQWVNRLIGDRLDPKNRVLTPSSERPVKYGGPQNFSESGLRGPVMVLSQTPSH